MAVTVTGGTGWLGSVSPAAPDFWSTIEAVETMLSVSVVAVFSGIRASEGSSQAPFEAGGTIFVTRATNVMRTIDEEYK